MAHGQPTPAQYLRARHARSHPTPRLPRSSRLLRIGLVQPQHRHECRLAAGRDAAALVVPPDGLHCVRSGRGGRATRLVTARQQAAGVDSAVPRWRARPTHAPAWPPRANFAKFRKRFLGLVHKASPTVRVSFVSQTCKMPRSWDGGCGRNVSTALGFPIEGRHQREENSPIAWRSATSTTARAQANRWSRPAMSWSG